MKIPGFKPWSILNAQGWSIFNERQHTIHTILRNRLYTGEFEWDGMLYQGKHQPLVSKAVWDQVQAVIDRRFASKHRKVKHEFAYSHLISCGHCGCALVGELKKQRYVYYHCTGYKGRCGEPYVREEVLDQQFGALLDQLRFDPEILALVRAALLESHADEKREREEAIERLQSECKRIQGRLDAMYIDKLDGMVDQAFFDRMSSQWRSELQRCMHDITVHQSADRSYMADGVRLLELAQRAREMFEERSAIEKRKLLQILLSNSSWKRGALTVTLKEPFDLLLKTNGIQKSEKPAKGVSGGLCTNWLGD